MATSRMSDMTRVEFEARFKERWFAGNRKAAHIIIDACGEPRGWGASLDAAVYYAEEQGVKVQQTH